MRRLNPRFNRAIHKDGAEPMTLDGQTYTFEPFEVIAQAHRTAERKEYRRTCYAVTPEGFQYPLGYVSEMTPDNRIESLIRRAKNPVHFEPFSFVAVVRTIDSKERREGRSVSRSRSYYVAIPREVVNRYGLLVDDEIAYQLEIIPDDPEQDVRKITEPEERTEFYYHIGSYGGNLAINLKKYRNACIKADLDPEIRRGTRVRVNVRPHPSALGRLDLTPVTARAVDGDNDGNE